jgi:hypothetical protein
VLSARQGNAAYPIEIWRHRLLISGSEVRIFAHPPMNSMTYFDRGVTSVFAVHTPCAPVRKVARVGSRNLNPRVGDSSPSTATNDVCPFRRSSVFRVAGIRRARGYRPRCRPQGPAWAHRCAPRRFGSTDLSIGPGQGDAAEPGTSTLILC